MQNILESKAFLAKNENLDFLLQNSTSSDAFCEQTKHFQKNVIKKVHVKRIKLIWVNGLK